MSQSDYIKYKRVSNRLKNYNESSVIESQSYLDYKEYTIENSIIVTKNVYHQLTPSGEQIVFNMEKNVTNCPAFQICKNTNSRPNRVPMSSVYYNPTPQPLNWTQKKKINDGKKSVQKNACKCIPNSVYTNANICSCKLGV